MAIYRLRRRPLLMALFIFAKIQEITSFPHKGDFYQNHETRLEDGHHENTKSVGKIVSPSSSYFNSGYRFLNIESSTAAQRSKLDWDLQNRRKVEDQESRPPEDTESDSRIVFPSEDIYYTTEKISSVPVCEGKTFCEYTSYYPEDMIKNAISRSGDIYFLSNVDVIPDVVHQRIDLDLSEETMLCVSTEQIIYPKTAETQDNEWLFVVNHENLKQGVRVETCSNADAECNSIIDLPEGYRSFCKQKFIYRQLAAYAKNDTIIPGMFRFPSSCCCHIENSGKRYNRMGISLGKSNVTPVLKKTTKK